MSVDSTSDTAEIPRPNSFRPDAIEWSCLIVGYGLMLRYAWTLDDAFVYYRYVDNLIYLGHGLVYNAGEYVEGFSSPLWCLILILLRAVGFDFREITVLAGTICFVGFWYGLVRIHRVASPIPARYLNLPMVLLCLNYGVLCYFTSGLESPLMLVSAVAYVLFVFETQRRVLQFVVAVSPLIRPEFAVPLAIVLCWQWWSLRRVPWFTLTSALVLNLSWLGFRIYYYADLFPTTFYLKNINNIGQGFLYVHDTLIAYGGYVILPALMIITCIAFTQKRMSLPPRIALLTIALASVAYTIKVGGDPRHFRYLAFAYVVFICVFAGVLPAFLVGPLGSRDRRATQVIALGVARVCVVIAAIFTMACYPRQLNEHPFLGAKSSTLIDGISDAQYQRDELGSLFNLTVRPAENIFDSERYSEQSENAYDGLSVTGFCLKAYQDFDWRVVHFYGLTEPVLARTEMHSDLPAHKLGLRRLAFDLAFAQTAYEGAPTQGLYEDFVARGDAPPWIQNNIEIIKLVERKMFNNHRFLENLTLALTPTPLIVPPKYGENYVVNDRFLIGASTSPRYWYLYGEDLEIDCSELEILRIRTSDEEFHVVQEVALPPDIGGSHLLDVSVEVKWRGPGEVRLLAREIVAPEFTLAHGVFDARMKQRWKRQGGQSVATESSEDWKTLHLKIETMEINPRPAIIFQLDVYGVVDSDVWIRSPKVLLLK